MKRFVLLFAEHCLSKLGLEGEDVFLRISFKGAQDSKLLKFKQEESNRGKVCREGLWYYTRHPNYFFEWIIWISFALFAIQSPLGWVGLISPLLMLYFVTSLTGIPITERHLLKSKGEAYKKYQEVTSPFIPWPPSNPKRP